MDRSLTYRGAHLVTSHWRPVLVFWIVAAVLLWLAAPAWKDIAFDGDFEYLPPDRTSVAAGRLLDRAFPAERSRSQIVVVLGRERAALTPEDEIVGLDLLRRLYHRLAEVSWQRGVERWEDAVGDGFDAGLLSDDSPGQRWMQLARESLNRSIAIDEKFYAAVSDRLPREPPTLREPRMAIAYWDRAEIKRLFEENEAEIKADLEAATLLRPGISQEVIPIEQRRLAGWYSLLDVLSWEDRVIGPRLRSEGARLTVLKLSSELAATSNIETVHAVNRLIDDVLDYSARFTQNDLQLLITGSAAIGGETLIAARDAIRYTEWFTVFMVLAILVVVYRAPLLVLIPVVSIGVAVLVSSSLVALLTQWSIDGTVPWLDLRVFTTSRIFVVVILFGAGTDYCLFLIARLREEAAKAEWPDASANALRGVMGALFGSAMTTVAGLGMLWIARFGKFHYTGPVIAICLLVGLLVCVTFTPALLRALGPIVFWPTVIAPSGSHRTTLFGSAATGDDVRRGTGGGIWGWIALRLTRRPLLSLCIGLALLAVPSVYGWNQEDQVTYDLSSQLSPSAASRRGYELLAREFDIGEVNPVTLLLLRPEDVERNALERDIKALRKDIYSLPGVVAVRTADDPLGDFPPDREMGLLDPDAWRRRALRNHRIAKRYFFSEVPEYRDRLTRLDVVLEGDPFSIETAALVTKLQRSLESSFQSPDSPWHGSDVLFAGTTPSIIDLRSVTLADNRRIKLAVIAAVFLVLVLVIKRVGLCAYLIATVLISYYATLGLTVLFFRQMYGDDYVGLDWKLPLFLFVILVAVGQDYNVYLVTRIVEEQRRLGWLAALRRAVARTGGIITACGVVMAGTFLSMTTSAWVPLVADFFGISTNDGATARSTLRGIVELGFALGLGVLIDTFYVRTILVPSFVAVLGKLKPRRSKS